MAATTKPISISPIRIPRKRVLWFGEGTLPPAVMSPFTSLHLRSAGISEVVHPYSHDRVPDKHHLLFYPVQGKFSVKVRSENVALKPGMVAFMPAGSPMTRKLVGRTGIHLYFQIRKNKRWDKLARDGAYFRKTGVADLLHMVLRYFLQATVYGEGEDILAAKDYAELLSRLLLRDLRGESRSTEQDHEEHIARVFDRVREDPRIPWTVALMAREAMLSQTHFHRLCSTLLGAAPMTIVRRIRMQRAADLLLSTDDKIEAIARSVGYDSVQSFSRLFLRHTGRRPGQFRLDAAH